MIELEVAEQCVGYLSNLQSYEKLPHSQVSLNDIRHLYAQMRGKIPPKIIDPVLISGVLQSSLKDLQPCLLHPIYEDLMIFDNFDEKEDIANVIVYIRNILMKLPQRQFVLFMQLCNVLCKSSSHSSYAQLAANMTPYICRPSQGAFMSIRHMDDLRRIRPSIQSILENYFEIFDNLTSNELKSTSSYTSSSIEPSYPRSSQASSPSSSHFRKKIDPSEINIDHRTHVNEFVQKSNRSHDYESIEWKILEALVSIKVKSFLNVPKESLPVSDEIDQRCRFLDVKPESDTVSVLSTDTKEKKPKHRTHSLIMTERRLMISECKAMKAQVTECRMDIRMCHVTYAGVLDC